jgi:hypothetical protein
VPWHSRPARGWCAGGLPAAVRGVPWWLRLACHPVLARCRSISLRSTLYAPVTAHHLSSQLLVPPSHLPPHPSMDTLKMQMHRSLAGWTPLPRPLHRPLSSICGASSSTTVTKGTQGIRAGRTGILAGKDGRAAHRSSPGDGLFFNLTLVKVFNLAFLPLIIAKQAILTPAGPGMWG